MAAAAGIALLAAAPCFAQVKAQVRPAECEAARFGTVSVQVVVDLGSTGELLGGYGATLQWDPSKLGYLGDTGGGEPDFDDAVVNRDAAGSGLLAFADAAASGRGGKVEILEVGFEVLADPYATAVVDLEITSMYAASTYEDLLPILAVADGTIRIADYAFDLHPINLSGSLFSWDAAPGAVSYDLIRGSLGSLHDNGSAVQLGTVVCVEDDSSDTTTAAGAEAASPDASVPAAGAAYFYLVRYHDGVSNRSYGFSHKAGHERQAGPGDCP